MTVLTSPSVSTSDSNLNITKMKKIIKYAALSLGVLLSGCNEYIDILPKGEKIPQTLEDFKPLLSDEYSVCQMPVAQALYLMNEYFVASNVRGSSDLRAANYMWNESADRANLNRGGESCFYYGYQSINIHNLLCTEVPKCTEASEAERNEWISYARVLRALSYLQIVNYYADAYQADKAASTPGIPLILSADVNAPYTQVSVGEIYDFILSELRDVISLNALPAQGYTILHPGKYAAQAVLAKTLLMTGDYSGALAAAEEALKGNDQLYDWVEFYNANKDNVDDPANYTNIPSQMGYDNVENILYRSGDRSPNYDQNDLNMPLERGAKFEDGDARFAVRWKSYKSNTDTYYRGMTSGYFNYGGIRTPEIYLIKAECLARTGKVAEAMNVVNTVRKTRILPEKYADMTASSETDAIRKIYDVKANELVMTLVPFMDAKRLNAEGKVTITLTKEDNGKTYTLAPDSHLWTMVFPYEALTNHGNGSLTQNSK